MVTNGTRGQERVSRVMIGKYERGEAIPSIDAAEGINSKLDKQALKRLQDWEHLGLQH